MFGEVAYAEPSPCKTFLFVSTKWRKNLGKLKIPPQKPKRSNMPLVRTMYHGLMRRVAACSKQGRDDGGKGAQFPRRQISAGAPKSPKNVTSTSVQ